MAANPQIVFLAERDGAECFYCGVMFLDDLSDASRDHLVPQVLGGRWVLSNLVLACLPCNREKGERMPLDFLGRDGCRVPMARRAVVIARLASMNYPGVSKRRKRYPQGYPLHPSQVLALSDVICGPDVMR